MSSAPEWTRRGLLVRPRGDAAWRTHAQNPTVLPLSDDCWRIYFSGRTEANHATLFAVDVDPRRDMHVQAEYFTPLLQPGGTGAFDAGGLGPSCAIMVSGRVRLYYAALTGRSGVPFDCAIGVAKSDDGLAFERLTAGPVLAWGPYDPYYVSTPFVRAIEAGYEMWYQSVTGWNGVASALEAQYTIRRTVSADGIVWDPATKLAIAGNDDAACLTRPWIAQTGGSARLWCSRRGADSAYRIVSAPLTSNGTCTAAPMEEAKFVNAPRSGDWDDRMQAYACIVRRGDGAVMFYNGNDFGRDGFGWATAADAG